MQQEQPLSLHHRDILNALWRPLCLRYDLQYAEYSFANAFLFRRQHHYTFLPLDIPLVKGKFSSGGPYLIPTALPTIDSVASLQNLVDEELCLYPIPEVWKNGLHRDGFHISCRRADSDYLFTREKLQELKGRALSSRRNLLHQLEDHHTLSSTPLSANNSPDAAQVLETWQRHSTLSKDQTDYLPCQDALQFREELALLGRVAYADGQPIGFTVGELLTPTTALLHISKSLHSIKGATPFLYRDFVRHLPQTVKWINLEQDLGIPALRQAKKAYCPDRLLHKYRLCK